MNKISTVFWYWINYLIVKSYSYWLINSKIKTIKLGNGYGGWYVPLKLLNKNSVCYLVGAGEDISFDLALIKKVHCQVWSFDPTPRAIAYVKKTTAHLAAYHFFPWGIWDRDQKMKFFTPQNLEHVSHSITNLQQTNQFFMAQCYQLTTIASKLKHSQVDLLKLDIEGAEHKVLANVLKSKLLPKIFLVEFDQPDSVNRILSSINCLLKKYELVKQDLWNFTFVLKNYDQK